mmetsp:Transcript_92872/g.149938  ORF Transcript_92872/g.149938 Transcript_92872/m.149938 type:complete len:638 (+) Transcript_92872:319-2232(+)
MGNNGSIQVSHADRPPDEIFQIKIANAGNSCYMDSVLFSMFAMPSPILDGMLTKRQPAADHLAVQKQELQACLLKQFVWRLRHCEHVTAESMTNIRAMCRRVGWEYPGAPDMQQDAGEFFAFLHGCLGGQLIRTTRRTFTGALPDNSDRGHEENMALLPVALCDSHPQRNDELNLSSLVDTFFFENVAAGLRRKVQGQQQEVYALNTYSVDNVPCVVAVSLKRFDERLLKIETEVNFPSTLNLHRYSGRAEWRSSPIMQSVPWTLKSVVCHRGRSTQAGHYYAYTRYSKHESPSSVWLRLDDDSTPCITQTNIWQDPYVKSEAVLFLYELDSDAHTTAMMMLQEEEDQGMFESADGFGAFGLGAFGEGAFGNGGSASAYEIPQSLPSSMLSTLGGMSSSSSTLQATPLKPIATGNDTSPAQPSPVLTFTGNEEKSEAASEMSAHLAQPVHLQEAKDMDAPADVVKPLSSDPQGCPGQKTETPKQKMEEVMEGKVMETQPDAHLPLSLEDIEFLCTPNRSSPVVVHRKPDHIQERACHEQRGQAGGYAVAGGDGVVKVQWEARFEMGAGQGDALVCVSALDSLHRQSARAREVKVSILSFPERGLVCSSLLNVQHPSAILALGSAAAGCTFVAFLEEQ